MIEKTGRELGEERIPERGHAGAAACGEHAKPAAWGHAAYSMNPPRGSTRPYSPRSHPL